MPQSKTCRKGRELAAKFDFQIYPPAIDALVIEIEMTWSGLKWLSDAIEKGNVNNHGYYLSKY